MKILAFELSTARGSLAWLDGETEFFREWPNDRKNSGAFFENIEVVAKKFGPAEKIIVGLGPGSYAGTRIAISTAIGLKISSGAQLLGYPSICAMEGDEYCVIGDARRNSFFYADVRAHQLVEGPILFSETELKAKLDTINARLSIFCSEALPQFGPAVIRYPSALLLARLAQDSKRGFSLPPLEPIYLREAHITMPKPKPMSS